MISQLRFGAISAMGWKDKTSYYFHKSEQTSREEFNLLKQLQPDKNLNYDHSSAELSLLESPDTDEFYIGRSQNDDRLLKNFGVYRPIQTLEFAPLLEIIKHSDLPDDDKQHLVRSLKYSAKKAELVSQMQRLLTKGANPDSLKVIPQEGGKPN